MKILEKQIKNYNKREKFWIKQLNSLSPNGYNILEGGESPLYYKGEKHPSSKLTQQEVLEIKSFLKNSNLSLTEIANKYNISKKQILRINQGISWTELNDSYPIRINPISSKKISEEDIILIRGLLEFTYFFNGDIARMFNVEVHLISDINSGKAYFNEEICYPIREWKSCGKVQFTYEQVSEIIYLLQNTDTSFRDIARHFSCEHSIISQINQGSTKKYKRKSLSYPIRKF